MQHRIVGVLVAAAALYLGFVFSRAFVNSAEYVSAFIEMNDAIETPIPDPIDFLLHWRLTYGLTYGLMTLFAALGFLAGVAMFFLKRWSWLIIATIAAICAALGIIGTWSGYLRYGFERSGFLSHLALLLLAASAVYCYRNWGREQTHVRNA